MIDVNAIVKANKSVLTTYVDDELGMMNMDKGYYYTLNSVGKRIWEIADDNITVEEIIKKLMSEYNIDYKTCSYDVLDILNLLQNNGLIEVKTEEVVDRRVL